MRKIEFGSMEWVDLAAGTRAKIWNDAGRRVRVLELDEQQVVPEWRENSHVGMILEGTLEINCCGTVHSFGKGDGLAIPKCDRQKARAVGGVARLVLFEEV
ncbi:MAG: hypothetical protein ABI811_17420 [Acidobacteriota bacterium]